MTLTAADVVRSVFGVYRLARFDPAGVGYLDRTPEGALKSFYAGVIVLPAYALLLVIRLWEPMQGVPMSSAMVVEGIAYVVSWTAFPVMMHQILGSIGRGERFIDFLCAYNWSSVVQMGVYLPAVVLAETGLLPDTLGQGLVFGVMMAMLTYQWFILRTTIGVSGLAAAGFVMLDLFTSALITDFADGILL